MKYLTCIFCLIFLNSFAQKVAEPPAADAFNQFKYVKVHEQQYPDGTMDSWSVATLLADKFEEIGLKVIRGNILPAEVVQNPCLVLHCYPSHLMVFGGADMLGLSIRNCEEELLYSYRVSAMSYSHTAETLALVKKAFSRLTQKIKYHFDNTKVIQRITIAKPEPPQENILTGKWVGGLTQNGGGTSNQYYYELNITNEGVKVIGESYIKDNTIFARKKVFGYFKENILVFEEMKITEQQTPTSINWLLLDCDTVYTKKGNIQTIIGTWHSGAFTGNLSLTKVN